MNTLWLHERFEALATLRALVVGDVIIDRVTNGSATRLCPEAPVPVARSFFVSGMGSVQTLGGAGNVAANLAGLGVETTLAGVVAEDAREEIGRLAMKQRVSPAGIATHPLVVTPIKHRYYASGQMMMRHDIERNDTFLAVEDAFWEFWREILLALLDERPNLIVISDYAKGSITQYIAHSILSHVWRELGDECLVVVDSKSDPTWFRKADIMTPNVAELQELLGRWPIDADIDQQVAGVATGWQKALDVDYVAVTRGGLGALAVGPGKNGDYVAHRGHLERAYDVAGAGDTFTAAFGAQMAEGARLSDALTFAVWAAGEVCKEPGVTSFRRGMVEVLRPSKVQDARTLPQVVRPWHQNGESIAVVNGCFDVLHEGHVYLLFQAARLAQHVVAFVNSDPMVAELKGPPRPLRRAHDRLQTLASMENVDVVCEFHSEDQLQELIRAVDPVVIVRGDDHRGHESGESCPIHYVERLNVSSSSLIEKGATSL